MVFKGAHYIRVARQALYLISTIHKLLICITNRRFTACGKTRESSGQAGGLHEIMARLPGLEPGTLGLEGRCSIQLSYRRIPTGEKWSG